MDQFPERATALSPVSGSSLSSAFLTGDGAWEWDIPSGDVRWQSAGTPSSRSNGKIEDFTDILHPDDRTRVWNKLNGLMTRHEVLYADEYRFMHPDGSVRWMSGTGRFYFDDGGKAVRMSGVLLDITERRREQDALRASEERYARAFRASPHPIGITELATGRCIEVNDACVQLFGFCREEVIGHTTLMLGIWPKPEDRARLIERLQAGEAVRNLELSFKTKSGDVRHILVSSDVIELSGTQCLVTIGNDITERKQTEAKLHESEERLRLAQSAANVGTFDWDIQSGTIVWSPEMERIWGLPAGGFDGTYEHWRRQVHPEDAAEVERMVRLSLEHPYVPHKYEHRIVRSDGTVRWIHVNATARCDTTGRPIRMVGVNLDITERKDAEGGLRESEARFRKVFEHAGTGIVIANLYGGSVQCNPAYCAMLGYTEDELRAVDFSQLVHPDDRDANLAGIKRLLAEHLPHFEIENRYVHKDGHPVWVRKFVSLLRDQKGDPRYLVALATDMTERRMAQERMARWTTILEKAVSDRTAELLQSQKRLRALAGELSLAEQRERKRLAGELHDHLQQLLVFGKMTIAQGKRAADGASACEAAFNRLDDVLSEALTYSRTLVAELCPPVLRDRGFADGLEWLATYMKKHGQTVTVRVPEETKVCLSEDQAVLLFQSVRELLINSSKHAGTGQAMVTLEQGDRDLSITVRDEGTGFDVTAVAAAAPSTGGISSKFGLFSIQERMLALGGRFELRSAPGQGTTVTLRLPLMRND